MVDYVVFGVYPGYFVCWLHVTRNCVPSTADRKGINVNGCG